MPKKVRNKVISKKQKTSSRVRRKRFFVGLGLAGLWILGVSLVHRALYWRAINLDANLIKQTTATESKVVPVRLKIWNMVDIPIKVAPFIDNQWVVSNIGATYLGPSAGIKEVGNMIIYGHNRRENLGEIRVFKGGEKFSIWGSDGAEYKYQVIKVVEVNPDETKWLEAGGEHELTMYTCSGWMDSKRFIVKAKLLDED